jgi:hypothetical protein
MEASSRHTTISFYHSLIQFFFFILNQNILWTMTSINSLTSFLMFIKILIIFSFLNNLTNAQGMSSRSLWNLYSFLNVVCTTDVCNKHGTCIPNTSNSFTCQCDPGFIGPTCNQGSFIRHNRQKNKLVVY